MGLEKKEIALFEFMKVIARLNLNVKHKADWLVMKHSLDSLLAKMCKADHSAGIPELTWLTSYEKVLKLVAGEEDIDAIKAANGQFKHVRAEITRAMKLSKTAEKLFSFVSLQIGSGDLSEQMKAALQAVLNDAYSQVAVAAYKTKVSEALLARKVAFPNSLVTCQIAPYTLVGTEFHHATDLRSECLLRLSCELRDKALGCLDGIPLYPHEKLAFPHLAANSSTKSPVY